MWLVHGQRVAKWQYWGLKPVLFNTGVWALTCCAIFLSPCTLGHGNLDGCSLSRCLSCSLVSPSPSHACSCLLFSADSAWPSQHALQLSQHRLWWELMSAYGMRFQEKLIYKENQVKHFSVLCLEKLVSPEFLAGFLLITPGIWH